MFKYSNQYLFDITDGSKRNAGKGEYEAISSSLTCFINTRSYCYQLQYHHNVPQVGTESTSSGTVNKLWTDCSIIPARGNALFFSMLLVLCRKLCDFLPFSTWWEPTRQSKVCIASIGVTDFVFLCLERRLV